ncbi:alpha/beta-hydrolase [Parathielavia appendiculata]|uniref:Alpha/beta-hydrolase n=1 Tax=Parathielavia appendiculata TaxID=2587402 RepID=A0AAN6TUS6_9PEZI|nr:alpha/beta-hydrolase [Parathielavia appendiculata]
MTDELATKAPESDAQATNPTPPQASADSPAPTNPPMGDHCTSDRPTPTGRSSTGEITKLNDVDVYISKPADYPHTPSRLLLLLTGGTGLHSINNQLQADTFATHGYVVVMPDLFAGDPAPNSRVESSSDNTKQPPSSHLEGGGRGASSLLDTLRLKAAETAKSFLIDMWLARHTEEKVLPILDKVLDGAGDEFADAASHGGGVYAVGYCFGARYVLLLAAEKVGGKQQQRQGGEGGGTGDEEAGVVAPRIKAGALAHPTLVSKGDWEGLTAPLSVVCVENDPLFPDEVRIAGEEYMSGNGVEHEVQVYPGMPHGFAVVGEYEDANIKVAQATAFDQMLKWINEH